jgi:succinoglycan biosynthesis transport protein ExoP
VALSTLPFFRPEWMTKASCSSMIRNQLMGANESLPPEDTFRLREYLGVLRLRKWSVIVIAMLALLASLGYASIQTPIYTATAKVQATNPLAVIQANPLAVPNMDTERAVAGSTDVTKCATQILAHPTTTDLDSLCAPSKLSAVPPALGAKKSLTVTVPQNTTILTIAYSDPSPAKAQAGAQAFAEAYVEVKTLQAKTALAQQSAGPLADKKAIEAKQAKLQEQISAAAHKIPPDNITASYLQNQFNNLSNQLSFALQQLTVLAPSKIIPPQVTSQANLPTSPSSPKKALDAAIGLFVGLAFGVGLALLRERLDDRLRGRGDLEENLGAPVLAVIPRVPDWRRKQDSKLVTLEHPKSATVEAYRTLRTGVLFAAAQRGLKSIMVCSPSAGEGKTTTAANLAVVLADANRRVILVSADLRKPRVHRFFKLKNDAGLSSALTGEVKPWQALQDPKIDNLRVLSSGPVPARPAELLQSDQMGELLAELRDVADFVIIDTAPVLLVADALALAPLVDGVLFVADAEGTSRGAVAHARESLEQVGAPLLGSVLNNFDPTKVSGYYHYGSYRYGRYGYGRYGYGGTYGGQQVYGDGETRRQAAPLGEQSERRGF